MTQTHIRQLLIINRLKRDGFLSTAEALTLFIETYGTECATLSAPDEHERRAPDCSECEDEATTYEPDNDAWYCDKHACDHSDHDGHCCLICGADLSEHLAANAYDAAKARKDD